MTLNSRATPEPASGRDDTPDDDVRRKPSPAPRPRPTRRNADDGSSESDSAGADAGSGRGLVRFGRPRRRAVVLACLTAVAVLLSGAAAWFALEANRLREGKPEDNSALVDATATAQVRERVSSAVESLFSYNHSSLDRTRRAAERVLLDEALRNYSAKLSEVSEAAKKDRVVRTASVRGIGVRDLHDGTARVLVFLDQQTLSSGEDGRSRKTVYLEVVAKKVGGTWKIAKLGGT